MKIPITYLILVLVAALTLGFLGHQYKTVLREADKKAKIEESRRIDEFCQSVASVKDLSFAMKRGREFFLNKKYQLAAAYFDQAASLDENYRDSWFWAGYANMRDLQARQKDLNESKQREILARAKSDLEQAAKIDPLYPETSKLLASIAQSEKNDKEKDLWYARYETAVGKKLSEVTFTKNK